MKKSLIIGTRGSALALVQTHWVRAELNRRYPDVDVQVRIIQTTGDKSQSSNVPLASYGEKGIFAKELESALLSEEIDLAVHSMKDVSAVLPEGLHIVAVPLRQDVSDALVGKTLGQLNPGDRIGTGSVRRTALLKQLRPDLDIVDIRGNVDTRIKKLRDGNYESIVLAVAGLNRLSRSDEISEVLNPKTFVPDPGQGALAIQSRDADRSVNELLQPLNHTQSFVAVTAERAFLAEYGGGCQTPVGAWASVAGDTLRLIAMAALGGQRPKFTQIEGSIENPAALAIAAADRLR